jgi:hypothetical protein
MAPKYPTLSAVLEAVNEDRSIDRSDVPVRVQRAQVWHAIVSFPGCLGDSHSVARSKESALSSVEYWLDDGEGSKEYSARYVRGQLRRNGICYIRDGRVITLNQHAVSDLF